jgi:flagellar biosynthesis chaperone FliJ
VSGSIITSSDVKLKENIEDITDIETEEILKVKAKKYNYKNDENKKLRYGVIAQELEDFFPNLVSEITEDDGSVTKGVNYIDMIPVLLCKIQKMQKEIDTLKEKLDVKIENC